MKKSLFLSLALLLAANCAWAWQDMDMPRLKVEGRYLTDQQGNVVNLHGFAQTYSPWFNEQGSKWTNYDVSACLKYNKQKIDQIMDAGWEMSFLRLHMDPYWSNTPGVQVTGENDISAFDFDRFKKYLDQVFIPMAQYAIGKGMYVVMRPPGVCPGDIAVGDAYQKYLIKVWTYVANHKDLKNHPAIMFELANEPVRILGPDGTYGSGTQGHFDNLKIYFQEIVDAVRAQGASNILWIPGLGYQSQYSGFATNPIDGENIGYAVHCYPGWYGSDAEADSGEGIGTASGGGYETFIKGWNSQIKPIADIAPIMVTEMDWALSKYNSSWGKSTTGTAGGSGFGANFKYITDEMGNVSWLLFTDPSLLAQFKDEEPANGKYTFLNDPEACPWPIYHWYQDYKTVNYPHPEFTYRSLADNGNGFYTNPVIYGDFPDPDVICVDGVYYMVSTTMHVFPGATILKSTDLVNWSYCCNPLESIANDDPYSLLNGSNRYGAGQWASSLQWHDGTFYLMFMTNNDGGYLLTASDPEGTWEKKKLPQGFYDCGLLFDDDDIYVVYGINELHVAQLDENFTKVRDEHVITNTLRSGLEGSHFYKKDDYYYVYSTYGGIPGVQVCFRSKSPWGPYEEKIVLDSNQSIHQGALVQAPDGMWYTMLMRDWWPYGRLPYLLPVYWQEDWPVIDLHDDWDEFYDVPYGVGSPIRALPTNDAFRHYNLGKQWGWNHNPDAKKWSLVERAGFLRLYAASVTNDLYYARNTLTQRMLGYRNDLDHSYATVAIDVANMLDGDRAGLAALQDPYSCVGIKKENGQYCFYYECASLTQKIGKKELSGNETNATVVYLRGDASFKTGKVRYYVSTDNQTWTQLGDEFTMQYDLSVFTGNKWAIFNYSTAQLGGWVDVDWFSTDPEFTEDKYYDNNFTGYTAESLTVDYISTTVDQVVLLTGSNVTLDVFAVYQDGHQENISMAAEYASSNPSVVEVVNGRITALCDGKASLTITYVAPLGEPKTIVVDVEATTFPLLSQYFNPSFWESGTFDEDTHRVTVGQYGFAAWQYPNGVDLSAYKYCVAKYKSRDNMGDGLSFRLFDVNNYWTDCAQCDAGSNMYSVATLQDMYTRSDSPRKLDPSHLYIIGFWSYGQAHNGFEIDRVYVTNDDDYLNDGIEAVEIDLSEFSHVYTISGIYLGYIIPKSLPNGIYIINNKKVQITL